jgi:putative aldouronate transport system permease protein
MSQSFKLPNEWHRTKKRIGEHKLFYLFLLPGIIWFIIFAYIPLYGLSLAFKDYNYGLGMLGSPWAGLKYFHQFFDFYQSKDIIKNTIVISLMKVLFGFPAPIIIAILLNEVRINSFKRTVQTIFYLPHFISWVVVVTLLHRMLTPQGGPINDLLGMLGFESIFFMANLDWFYQLIVSSYIWKIFGWNSIIYLAAIAGIDQQLYEAAKIDGCGRMKQIWHITLPGIAAITIILFILESGTLMYAGYEQLLLMSNPATASIGTVLDVYVIRMGLEQGRLSYATAVGLFQSMIALVLVLTVNYLGKKFSDNSLF